MSELIKSDGDITALGVSEDEFYSGWVNFLKRHIGIKYKKQRSSCDMPQKSDF